MKTCAVCGCDYDGESCPDCAWFERYTRFHAHLRWARTWRLALTGLAVLVLFWGTDMAWVAPILLGLALREITRPLPAMPQGVREEALPESRAS